MLYSCFLVISRRLDYICRRFGTFCSIFIGGVSRKNHPTYTAYEDGTECEMQTTGNHPKVRIQYLEHGESLKSRIIPVQAWRGPEDFKRLRFPVFKTVAHECDKIVSPRHRPPLPPSNIPGTHFCSRVGRTQGHCAVLQLNAPPRFPRSRYSVCYCCMA